LQILYARAQEDPAMVPLLRACCAILTRESGDERGDAFAAIAYLETRVRSYLNESPLKNLVANARKAASLKRIKSINVFFQAVDAFLDEKYGLLQLADGGHFNEEGYLLANPDVAQAVATRDWPSGLAHFAQFGRHERRKQRTAPSHMRGRTRTLIYPLDLCRCTVSNAHLGRTVDAHAASREDFFSQELPGGVNVCTLIDSERLDATPIFNATGSFGEDTESFRKLEKELRWQSGAVYLAGLSNVVMDLVNGVVMYEGDKGWSDSFFATVLAPGGRRRSPDFFEIDGEVAHIGNPLEEEAIIRGETPLMICTTWATSANYGHWLMNSLLSIYLVLDELKAGKLKLICPPLSERRRSEIIRLGAPSEAIIETSSRYVHCPRAVYPSPLVTHAKMFPPRIALGFFEMLKQRFGSDNQSGPEFVFVSRSGFPSGRIMTNEKELEEALSALGFVTLLPHELTFAEQIDAMSRAKIVVGQFGAALWNISFMPRNGHVVEISTDNYVSNEYLHLSCLMGHTLTRVMVKSSQSRAYEGGEFGFEAPVARIEACVRSIMRQISKSSVANAAFS
jgi:capsular polysaccharide biosynthesis protein